MFFKREKQEQQQQQRTVRTKLREKRQVSARARRYYDEYELRMRARMLKRRTREEQVRDFIDKPRLDYRNLCTEQNKTENVGLVMCYFDIKQSDKLIASITKSCVIGAL